MKKIDLNDAERKNPKLWDEILKKIKIPSEKKRMKLRGYIVTVEGNYIIKKYENGNIEKIKKFK